MLTLPKLEPQYVCPGETHAISRSVHLSRLAAFYPKCRECPHRQEIGQLAQPSFDNEDASRPTLEEKSLFTLEGVRGVYLNEFTRHKAGELAAAFASLLWESLPLAGRSDARDSNSKRPIRRSGPVVVVGFDQRPSSPDIVTGVAAALRRMACQVVDIGQTSLPCFRFAVAHMQAAGGILISGHGSELSLTGLDFVGKQGKPISAAPRRPAKGDEASAARTFHLDDIHQRWQQGVVRPLRQGGTHRVFQATVPYLAGLWKHFHALRPLRVAIGCPVRFVREALDKLFENLPVALAWVEIPQRCRDLLNDNDPDVSRLRAAVEARSADFGFLIDDDGANVAVLDEHGLLVTPEDLLCTISTVLPAERSDAAVVIDNVARERLQPRIAAKKWRCWLGGWTQSDLWQAMRHESVICGGGGTGRVWFQETTPTTDAILTLARLLQVLSRDDAPLSKVLAEEASVVLKMPDCCPIIPPAIEGFGDEGFGTDVERIEVDGSDVLGGI